MVSAEMQPTDLQKYDRGLNAAKNILRRGISELWSGCKTEYNSAILHLHTRILRRLNVGVCQTIKF